MCCALLKFPVVVGSVTPPPPNPCVTDPLHVTSTGLLAALQAFADHVLASFSLTVTDTRGCSVTVNK